MRKDVKTLGQILSGLGDLLDGLSNLAETGADVLQTVGTKPGRPGVTYGWSVNTVAGPRSREQGNRPPVAAPPPRAATAVQEVFDEGEFVRTVIEMPGVVDGDIQFTVTGQELTIEARRHGGRSVIRLHVPAAVSMEGATSSYRNGIFEILLPKRRGTNGTR